MRDEKPIAKDPHTMWTARMPKSLASAADARAAGLRLFRSGYIRQLIRKDLKDAGVEVETNGSGTVFD